MSSYYQKPKYKVGDIIVFEEGDTDTGLENLVTTYVQSRIISAESVIWEGREEDPNWIYKTEYGGEDGDFIEEEIIIDKLN